MHTLIFLDTNVLLHYQDFGTLDWLKLTNVDAATIVFLPVTIRELNKQKDTGARPRIRKRAAAVLRSLNSLLGEAFEATIGDGVKVRLEDREPLLNFAAHELSRDVFDDHLIASIIEARNESLDLDVLLVTSDSGLALRAKARRQAIATLELPDNLKIVEEPDPEQERIRDLERRLREAESARPQLALAFDGGANSITFPRGSKIPLTNAEVEGAIQDVKVRVPKIGKPQEEQGPRVELIEGPP